MVTDQSKSYARFTTTIHKACDSCRTRSTQSNTSNALETSGLQEPQQSSATPAMQIRQQKRSNSNWCEQAKPKRRRRTGGLKCEQLQCERTVFTLHHAILTAARIRFWGGQHLPCTTAWDSILHMDPSILRQSDLLRSSCSCSSDRLRLQHLHSLD